MAAGVLLAARESVRMGRPKPLLRWGDTTLIDYQVGEALSAAARVLAFAVLATL